MDINKVWEEVLENVKNTVSTQVGYNVHVKSSVPVSATIESVSEILAGHADDLPEEAFFLVGDLDDAREKARTLRRAEA